MMKITGGLGPTQGGWVLGFLLIGLVGITPWESSGGAAVQDLAGRYEGAWTNLTFNSTGKAVIRINFAGTNATLQFDLSGPAFGYPSVAPITMPGTVQGNKILIDNKGVGVFGNITGTIDATLQTIEATLDNIPGGYIQKTTVTGTIKNGLINLTYIVYFNGLTSPTNPAHGIVVANSVIELQITHAAPVDAFVTLQWTGGHGPYQVQSRPHLGTGSWINYSSPTTNKTVQSPLNPASPQFFRVMGP